MEENKRRIIRALQHIPVRKGPVPTRCVVCHPVSLCKQKNTRRNLTLFCTSSYMVVAPTQEYRGQIDKKYRRNIEAIVRRPNRDEEPEPTSKCPISGAEVPITLLECPSTKVGLACVHDVFLLLYNSWWSWAIFSRRVRPNPYVN